MRDIAQTVGTLAKPCRRPWEIDVMIEDEILEIVRDQQDNGERLNEIADQFRGGRDVDDLIALLDSTDAELTAMGAWILGELRLDLYNFDHLISRLRRFLKHENPAVRFHAFGALFPALDWQDDAARTLLANLRKDPNEGVRRSAEAAAARLF
jgi:HEAT repeat protein